MQGATSLPFPPTRQQLQQEDHQHSNDQLGSFKLLLLLNWRWPTGQSLVFLPQWQPRGPCGTAETPRYGPTQYTNSVYHTVANAYMAETWQATYHDEETTVGPDCCQQCWIVENGPMGWVGAKGEPRGDES